MEIIYASRYRKCDLDAIAHLVHRERSVIAFLTEDIQNIAYYLPPYPLRHCTAILDRNVYTRITSLVRGDCVAPHAMYDYRWAAAVMAFCQIAKITFDYASSLQEYASQNGGEYAAVDFEHFYLADNCDPIAWVDFAVGRTQKLDLSSTKNLPPPEDMPSAKLLEEPIFEFRLNYISALKIATLSTRSDAPDRLMFELIDWMESEFVLGSAALHFANLLFSPSRYKGMLKKRTLKDIQNIAWDFALIQTWRRRLLKSPPDTEPVLLVTRDKVVRFIAERLLASSSSELKGFIVEPWKHARSKGEAIFERYQKLYNYIEANPDARRSRKEEMDLEYITNKQESEFLLMTT